MAYSPIARARQRMQLKIATNLADDELFDLLREQVTKARNTGKWDKATLRTVIREMKRRGYFERWPIPL